MGCRHPRDQIKSPENEKLVKFESSLNLILHPPSYYEALLSRLSPCKSFSSSLSLFQKFSKISFAPSLSDLLTNTLSSPSTSDLKPFKCFCILFSKGSDLEKGESLWYTFDTTIQDFLPSSSLLQMLKILLDSSVSITLPLACEERILDESKIKPWEKYLKERIASLHTKLGKHFTQGKEIVTKEEFLLRLQDRPEGMITTAAEIRAQLERTQVIPTKFAAPFKNMKVTKLTK